jgi:acetyl esterase/lipase
MPNHDEGSCLNTNHYDDKGNHLPRPPYHPYIEEQCSGLDIPPEPDASWLFNGSTAERAISNLPIVHTEVLVRPGSSIIRASAFAPQTSPGFGALRPCIFYIHPAGPWGGNRFCAIEQVLRWVIDLDLTCVSTEYCLSPEDTYPAAVLDCYDVLKHVMTYHHLFSNPTTIGVDKENICVLSGMGGAAVAASLALWIRRDIRNDKWTAGCNLKGMLLYSPMLLCSIDTTSAAQFYKGNIWDTYQVQTVWSHYVRGKMTVTA